LVISWSQVAAQQTLIYTEDYKPFKDGMELYNKAQYQAAQNKFKETIEGIGSPQDEIRIDAEYYSAVCALELFNQDAEYLLNQFVYNHPDNVRTKKVYFNLGKHHYRRKRYRDAIKYFKLVDKYELSENQQLEYHFKLGYCAFYTKDFKVARDNLVEVKDLESEYKIPAIYYYAHIAYSKDQFQLALEGFRLIDQSPSFGTIVPYYIGQILYRQNKFEEVARYGPIHYASISKKRKSEFAHIIGDAFYKIAKYDSAVSYLKTYNFIEKSSREDYYQFGYCYYQLGDFKNAIKYLSKVKSKKDSLAQIAFYQLGDAYIKNGQKDYARNAFKTASQLAFDKEIEEEALWSYAKLAYELSYNPYDEAIGAFHEYIDKYPESPNVDDAYEFLLNVYTTTKNYEAALASISRIQNKNEQMKKAYQAIAFNRGVELYHNNSFESAINSFEEARTFKIDKLLSSEAVYWQAEANFGIGDYQSAIEKYNAFKMESGAILTGKRPLADYNLGYTYLKRENYSASLTAFRQFIQGAATTDNDRKADAYLRIADNYFLLKEDDEAIKNYQISIEMAVRNGDYAHYQMARSQGFKGDQEGKIISLKGLLEKFPQSSYVVAAQYELGEAYLVQNKNEEALSYFEQIVANYSQNVNARRALFNIGVIHFRNGDYFLAKDVFNQVVDQYPNSEEKNAAVVQMKEVYKSIDQLDAYVEWLKSKGIDASFEELDNEYFSLAMNELDKEPVSCNKVIEKFENYLSKISKPKHGMVAYFYIAQCNYELQNYVKAVASYDKVIEATNNEYTEQALVEAAEINYYRLKAYQAALSNYATLEKVAQESENVNKALIGQMNCFFHLENFQYSREYARKVLNKITDDEDLNVTAQYIEAIALKELMEYSAALIALRKTTEITKSIKGAEAKFCIAEIFFMQEEYEECENEIHELVEQKPGYDYWLARGIILLADVYIVKGDNFNARYSLESVISGYKGDDDIIPMAQEKLLQIDELENKDVENSTNEETEEIDIGGDEGLRKKNLFGDSEESEPEKDKEKEDDHD